MSVTLGSKSTCRHRYSFKLCVGAQGSKKKKKIRTFVFKFTVQGQTSATQTDARQMRWDILTDSSLH